MAGLLSGWAANNPFYQGFDERRNAISGFGLGLMTGKDPSEGFANAAAGAMQGRGGDAEAAKIKQEEQKRQEAINATTEWLRNQAGTNPFAADMVSLVDAGAITPNQAFSEVYKTAQGGTSDWAKLNDGTLYNQRTGETMQIDGVGGMGATEYGLTPIWGQMPDGTFGYGVQGKDGSFKPVDTGDLQPLDPRSLAGERAFGTAVGTQQGQGAAAAPADISNAQAALDILDQIETSPELPWATGTAAVLNSIPGTGRFGFQKLVEQAKSGAFLSAVQQMRGMGALSNTEGQVATAAITRMDTALSEADFRKALADYRAIIQKGLDRAQSRIGAQPNVNAPRPGSGNQTSNGLSWSIEP
jgi:hypothetical protein